MYVPTNTYQPMNIIHEWVPTDSFLLEHESAFWTLCLMFFFLRRTLVLLLIHSSIIIAFIKCNLLLQCFHGYCATFVYWGVGTNFQKNCIYICTYHKSTNWKYKSYPPLKNRIYIKTVCKLLGAEFVVPFSSSSFSLALKSAWKSQEMTPFFVQKEVLGERKKNHDLSELWDFPATAWVWV